MPTCASSRPTRPPKTRKLRLAGAAPPPGSPLRPRRTTRPPDPPHLPRLHRPHPQPPHPATLARRTALAQPAALTAAAHALERLAPRGVERIAQEPSRRALLGPETFPGRGPEPVGELP